MTSLRSSIAALGLLLTCTAWAGPPIPTKLPGRFDLELDGDRIPALFSLQTPTEFELRLGELSFALTRESAKASVFTGSAASDGFTGALNGADLDLELRYVDKNTWTGTLSVDGQPSPVRLVRDFEPVGPGEGFDAGPAEPFASHLANAPGYPPSPPYADADGVYMGIDFNEVYWDDWGPVFYRGRLDGSARLLVIASDPGPTECLPFVRRGLVGDAGQRVQGLLDKLGLTRSYTLVNAFIYATRPSNVSKSVKLLRDSPDHADWRDAFYDMIVAENDLQAVLLLGGQSQKAFDQWNRSRQDRGLSDLEQELTVVYATHPSAGGHMGAWDSDRSKDMATAYRDAVTALRAVITPDDPAGPRLPNYGEVITEFDYGVIPQADLPETAREHAWLRDMSYARNRLKGSHKNPVRRIGRLTLEIRPPSGELSYLTVVNRDPSKPNQLPEFETSDTEPEPETPVDANQALVDEPLGE